MAFRPRVLALIAPAAAALAACGGTPAASSTVTVFSVTVSGSAPSVGATAQFSATAVVAGGADQLVTTQAAWTSSNAAVATVSGTGVVAGVAAGEADITATYQGVSGRSHVAIAAAGSPTFTLSGTVTDGTSGGVLPNIDIQVTDSAESVRSARSGNGGTYAVTGVAAGPATLSASAVSYQTTRLTVAISGDTRADIVLQRIVCVLTVSPTSASFSSSGGTATVTVTSQTAGCAWQATSNAAFITVTAGATGLDAGSVSFSVAVNTGAARSGTLTIAGTTVAVSQAAAPPLLTAVYDPALQAPVCNDVGVACDSGTLLAGSGSTELNQPNTLFNSCSDGVGAGHFGLVSFIRVSSVDGAALGPGKTVLISVSPAGSTAGTHHVYLAADALHPAWTEIGSGASSGGPFVFQTVLPSGSLQAVRVTRSFIGRFGPGPCATGPDDDNDDLVFRVQP
jgi:hypothetical protein